MSGATFLRAPGTIAREVEGEVLIVPVRDRVVDLDDCFYLLEDPVSVHLWTLLETEQTLDQLVESVVDAFDVQAPAATSDVASFLEELVRVGACTTT